MPTSNAKYTLGFLFNSDLSSVVLLLKNQPDWQRGLLNGCGGKIDPTDYSPEFAMRREAQEEIGVNIPWYRYLKVYGQEPAAWKMYVFYAVDDNAFNTARTVSDEGDVVRKDLDQLLLNDCLPNLRGLIPLAIEAIKFRGKE